MLGMNACNNSPLISNNASLHIDTAALLRAGSRSNGSTGSARNTDERALYERASAGVIEVQSVSARIAEKRVLLQKQQKAHEVADRAARLRERERARLNAKASSARRRACLSLARGRFDSGAATGPASKYSR